MRIFHVFWIISYFHLSEEINCFKKKPPKLMLLLFDGFSNEYLEFGHFPNIENFLHPTSEKIGAVKSKGIIPSYTTVTAGNLWTIATGLNQENHGIISNNIFNQKTNRTISVLTSDPSEEIDEFFQNFNNFDPFWITIKKHNPLIESCILYWPPARLFEGKWLNKSYSPKIYINGKYWEIAGISFQERFRQIEEHIDKCDMIVSYFHEPDFSGHGNGPNSKEVLQKLYEIDELIGKITELCDRKWKNNYNLIISTDHGMEEITEVITLTDYVDVNDYLIGTPDTDSVFYQIFPKEEKVNNLIEKLTKVPHSQIFAKDLNTLTKFSSISTSNRKLIKIIPSNLFYSRQNNSSPFFLHMENGYYLRTTKHDLLFNGHHGYAFVNNKKMLGVFIGRGSATYKRYSCPYIASDGHQSIPFIKW
ncbi:hypothetical protein SNEBB_000869 [Seison nebaliae]|nr:hypothetical protein SNEBB_000869 [Seison nebaliae]